MSTTPTTTETDNEDDVQCMSGKVSECVQSPETLNWVSTTGDEAGELGGIKAYFVERSSWRDEREDRGLEMEH